MIRAAMLSLVALGAATAVQAQEAPRWSLAIHGGAGVIERAGMTPEQDAAYRASLNRALEAGAAVLREGGAAMDAVQAAIEIMEDDPLFNAGRGAVFTAAGRNELDAAVMDGSDLRAGSVAGMTRTRHPIAAARAVMERSPHVMLAGEGADAFAESVGLQQVNPSWFFTERRWRGLETLLRERGDPIPMRPVDPSPQIISPPGEMAGVEPPLNERKFGTVGAVALDAQGRLAAGTSTGGMTGKRWGRIGDAPVIGAGTYASNAEGCAVSATGDGEYFIRATVARDICSAMGARYELLDEVSPAERAESRAICERDAATVAGGVCIYAMHHPGQSAAQNEIDQVQALGGSGGVIVLNREGEAFFAMNTSGMYRGSVGSNRLASVAIYGDETPRE